MDNSVIHKANSRGHAKHGWLNSYHTFSFADYYNPQRHNFGALRVLNDDEVDAGMGFGTHPHSNMEIISIPLEGELLHKDNMGNTAVIKYGDVQVMSAGTGIAHSEYNKNNDKPVKFLQIWIIPNKLNVTPRYGQLSLNPEDRHNKLQEIISPQEKNNTLWIHQNAWFYMACFDKGIKTNYTVNLLGNGVYIFVLKGRLNIHNQLLETRDGMGIWDAKTINLEAATNTEFLIMEVPLN